jgi:GT2 family glycosyltransferase
VANSELPSFDLVVATIDRVAELDRFLGSLEAQSHRRFRALVIDQNTDDRLRPVFAAHPELELVHLRSEPGLSRARNRALAVLDADAVGFPDDDCTYPEDLLEAVAFRLTERAELDGVAGRIVGTDGRASPSWKADPALLTPTNLWNRAASGALFLRRALIAAVGEFDDQLGLGAGTAWDSGEETDYVVRAIRSSARIEYDPDLVVLHDEKRFKGRSLSRRGFREGASVGYILRKNKYSIRTILPMLVRPVGGAAVSLAHLDTSGARFHVATLRGRVAGLRAVRRG